MKTFFHPDSIAVIGASDRKGSLGRQTITNLLYGYEGAVYPVNANYVDIEGIPCFPSVEKIPGPVDLAIVIVPAPAVPEALEACGRKGIYRVMIQSAGFSEVGAEGRALQDRCTAIAKRAGIRLWGPNCMGLVDIPRRHFFSFMHPKVYEDGLIPGRISLIVQSGMLSAGFLADLMSERSIGVGKACSIGNKSDVDECDILEYLLDDDETDAIALYLESIPRGRRFVEIASRAPKPIVVLKGGKSSAGAQAALSHTSSLAGNARLQNSLLSLAGVTIAHDFQQMMELARALAMIPDTPPCCRTAILTFSGGSGILSCDLLEEQGLSIARFSPETKKELGKIFPDWLPAANPVDLFPAFGLKGPLPAFAGAFAAVVKDPQVDVIFMHYFAGLYRNFEGMREMKEAADKEGKVVIMWVIGRREGARTFRQDAQKCGIPVHGELSRAVECLAAASRYRRRTNEDRGKMVNTKPFSCDISDLLSRGTGERVWDEYASKQLLKRCDIPVVEEMVVSSAAEAEDAAVAMGFPVVMKGLLPGQVHKTESGLVHLGIATPVDLRNAFEEMNTRMEGPGRIVIQRQVLGDYELIAGFLRDDQFGPCVMFGLGGILSELEKDVAFALAPLDRADAIALIRSIRGRKLLEGFRGMAPLNEEVMADILVSLGSLGTSCEQIEQIDINPLAISGGVPTAVDATIIVGGHKQ
ncbi:MAG: acetate--CoA ligase family protein [Deltaproteobacteria bacterium]|nr:acetate--CoA ligase family protein [Deltaproteobacteria bacterium]